MAQCTVTCFACRNSRDTGPKIWRENCEDCAEDCLNRHRRDTGHTDLHLAVTVDAPSITSLQGRIRHAAQVYELGLMA